MMSNHGRWRVHAQCDDINGQAFDLQLIKKITDLIKKK